MLTNVLKTIVQVDRDTLNVPPLQAPSNLLMWTASKMEADSSGHTMTVRYDAMQVQAKIMVLIRVGSKDGIAKNLRHVLRSEEFERVDRFLGQEAYIGSLSGTLSRSVQ